LRPAVFIIVLVGVAKIGKFTGGGGEPGFKGEYGGAFFHCGAAVGAELAEIEVEVLLVSVANFCRFLVGLEIIVPVGKTQTALAELEDDQVAVLIVLVGAVAKEAADAIFLEAGGGVEQAGDVVDSADGIDLGFEGIDTLLVDTRGIHTAYPEVADFLGHAAFRGAVGGGGGRFFADVAEPLIDIFLYKVTDAPAAFCRGNWSAFYPPAVGVIEKVGAGADGGVDVLGEKIRGGLLVFVVMTGGQGEGYYSEYAVEFHGEFDWLCKYGKLEDEGR